MGDKKDDDNPITIFFVVVAAVFGLLGLMILQFLLNAWVITRLWDWFAVPALGVQSLSIGYAIGLGMLALLFSRSKTSLKKEYREGLSDQLLQAVFEPMFILLIGWIVTWFL